MDGKTHLSALIRSIHVLSVMDSAVQPQTTVAPASGVPPAAEGDTGAPAENMPPPENNVPSADNQEGGASGTTAGPSVLGGDGTFILESSDLSDVSKTKVRNFRKRLAYDFWV